MYSSFNLNLPGTIRVSEAGPDDNFGEGMDVVRAEAVDHVSLMASLHGVLNPANVPDLGSLGIRLSPNALSLTLESSRVATGDRAFDVSVSIKLDRLSIEQLHAFLGFLLKCVPA